MAAVETRMKAPMLFAPTCGHFYPYPFLASGKILEHLYSSHFASLLMVTSWMRARFKPKIIEFAVTHGYVEGKT